jgi:hypothetical protein
VNLSELAQSLRLREARYCHAARAIIERRLQAKSAAGGERRIELLYLKNQATLICRKS